MNARVRVDVWLWRARLAKTRAAAARLVGEGGVRLIRNGQGRRLEKPSVELLAGDTLVFAEQGILKSIEVAALGTRRGPPGEARGLYRDLGAQADAEADPLA